MLLCNLQEEHAFEQKLPELYRPHETDYVLFDSLAQNFDKAAFKINSDSNPPVLTTGASDNHSIVSPANWQLSESHRHGNPMAVSGVNYCPCESAFDCISKKHANQELWREGFEGEPNISDAVSYKSSNYFSSDGFSDSQMNRQNSAPSISHYQTRGAVYLPGQPFKSLPDYTKYYSSSAQLSSPSEPRNYRTHPYSNS